VVEQAFVDGRNRAEEGDPVSPDGLQGPGGVEAFEKHDRASLEQDRYAQNVEPEGAEKGSRNQYDVVLTQLEEAPGVQAVVEGLPKRKERALGHPRSSRGVHDQLGVFGREVSTRPVVMRYRTSLEEALEGGAVRGSACLDTENLQGLCSHALEGGYRTILLGGAEDEDGWFRVFYLEAKLRWARRKFRGTKIAPMREAAK